LAYSSTIWLAAVNPEAFGFVCQSIISLFNERYFDLLCQYGTLPSSGCR
jgi:hypothetical protein